MSDTESDEKQIENKSTKSAKPSNSNPGQQIITAMATQRPNLKEPEPFDFSKASEWTDWKKRFERYRIATKLSQESSEEQVNRLIYIMGPQADKLLSALGLTEAEQKDYNRVIRAFDEQFKVKRNRTYERAVFNQRYQKEEESIEEFVADLYTLAEHCEYGPLKDDLICDRVVVGIRDKELSKRLQLIDNLTLDVAVTKAKQSAQVLTQ